MTTEPKPQKPAGARAGTISVLPRVAALPGADRRILRKRLEWPLKVIPKQARILYRGTR